MSPLGSDVARRNGIAHTGRCGTRVTILRLRLLVHLPQFLHDFSHFMDKLLYLVHFAINQAFLWNFVAKSIGFYSHS